MAREMTELQPVGDEEEAYSRLTALEGCVEAPSRAWTSLKGSSMGTGQPLRLKSLTLFLAGVVAVAVLAVIAVSVTVLRSPALQNRGSAELLLIEQERKVCAACKTYNSDTGVITDPALLGGAITFEDVQNKLSERCPDHCKRKRRSLSPKHFSHMFDTLDTVDEALSGGTCHTARGGELCFDLVYWAMSEGIKAHPHVFPTLTVKSSFEEVQRQLQKDRPGVCPMPCKGQKSEADMLLAEAAYSKWSGGSPGGEGKEKEEASGEEGPKCHTATKGESCYDNVIWIMTKGVFAHPKWFMGLNSASSFEEVQGHLHRHPNSTVHCPQPCKDSCHTALEGEPCYDGVTWAMKEGIKKHPRWFSGLHENSTFEQVQAQIHLNPNATVNCPRPCHQCHTAQLGERCHSAVVWVMKEGLISQSESYKGLSKFASFEEVQNHLHNNKSEAASECDVPCRPQSHNKDKAEKS